MTQQLKLDQEKYSRDPVWKNVLQSCMGKLVAFVTQNAAKVGYRRSLGTVLEYESLTGIAVCRHALHADRNHQPGLDKGRLGTYTSVINSRRRM